MFKPPPGSGDGRSTIGEAGPKIFADYVMNSGQGQYLTQLVLIT